MIAAGLTVLPHNKEDTLNTVFVYVSGILEGRKFYLLFYLDRLNKT